jgi:hypothetical protein
MNHTLLFCVIPAIITHNQREAPKSDFLCIAPLCVPADAESHWTLPYESLDFALSRFERRAGLVNLGRFRTLPDLDEVPVALKRRVAGLDDLIYTCGYGQHVGRKPNVQAIIGGFRCPAYPGAAVLSRRFCGRNYYKGFPQKVKRIPTGVESRQRLTPESTSTQPISTFCAWPRCAAGNRCGQRNYKRSLMQRIECCGP